MKVLLLTPPMYSLFTAYPATAYLTGYLREQGIETAQDDLSIKFALRLFSRKGMREAEAELRAKFGFCAKQPESIAHFLEHADHFVNIIEPVVKFLQGRAPELAGRIVSGRFLPPSHRPSKVWADVMIAASGSLKATLGPRLARSALQRSNELISDPSRILFGSMGLTEKARYLATIFIEDIAEAVVAGLDEYFELEYYAKELAQRYTDFGPMQRALRERETILTRNLDELIAESMAHHRPDVVGLSVPFAGMAYGALLVGKWIKRHSPNTKIIFGGGFASTSLREMSDTRVFDYVDYVVYDDGETPLRCLLEHLAGSRPVEKLRRTALLEGGKIVHKNCLAEKDVAHKAKPAPDYDGIEPARYLHVLDVAAPYRNIWTGSFQNKLTLAHGCYWKKCTFCDIHLDYIGRYDPTSAKHLIDQIESVRRQTGSDAFIFVDEAMPPNILRALSTELLERGITISWHGMARWESAFTPELARLMAAAGCVSVQGGLETPNDRLLKLMNKGVSLAEVARVTKNLADAGILTHASLMYGFPTQTVQETIDGLEYVRQLFVEGCLHSAFWNHWGLTTPSDIAKATDQYGVKAARPLSSGFSNYYMPNIDENSSADHVHLGKGLRTSLVRYLYGSELDRDVREWFQGMDVPAPSLSKTFVQDALRTSSSRRHAKSPAKQAAET